VSGLAQFTDTHAHLTHPDYCGDRDLVTRAAAAGVGRIITVGFDLATSRAGTEIAASATGIWHAPGVHPHDASQVRADTMSELRRLAGLPRAAAIGETGLDFYRNRSPRETQVVAFRLHLDLASELGLPVIVHSRDAHHEALAVWAESTCRVGVMHCFSGDGDVARRALDLGLYLGIAGPITFRNAERLRSVVRTAPRDRILLETDCPYLTPDPYRGKRNEPAYVPLIAQGVAQCWGVTAEEVASITNANAARCFPALADSP
jgi:TatD DNase family protein